MSVPFLLSFALVACAPESSVDTGTSPSTIVPGPLQVGAAEQALSLPVGTPLGGFTARLLAGGVDSRTSDYAHIFKPSAGIQTRIPMKAFWFHNGQEDLVLLQTALIYSYDGLVLELEERLSEATGRDLQDRVVVAVNHTHNAYGNFSGQTMFFLGGDKYDHENFTRLAETAEQVAVEAWESRQEASVGVGYAEDWDPDDEVYRDRRGENNDLVLFEDIPTGSYKDPVLWMMRVDTLEGDPLAALYGFGIHGTTLDYDNQLVSVDAPGHTEIVFQDTFSTPVVVGHFQAGAGDASPAGEDDGYARLETVGDAAVDALVELYESIRPEPVEVGLETRTRSVRQMLDDVGVDRGGEVDWSYLAYDEDLEPDLEVYEDDGSVASPIDEFNVAYGAAFCGEADSYIPLDAEYQFDVDVDPYRSCVLVDGFVPHLQSFFDLEDEEVELPMQETVRAMLSASRLGPLPTRFADGTTAEEHLLWTFFPGETCSLYTEMFRRRAEEELGITSAIPVGYAQDHEGYLLPTEDWLMGGYEPSINVWGPLQADYLMDQAFLMAEELLTEEREALDPHGIWDPEPWGPYTLPERTLDSTPDAGTLLAEPPDYLYAPLYSSDELEAGEGPELTPGGEIARVQGLVQVAWIGGDPAVDLPQVVLERLEDGDWQEVTTHAGRPVTEALPDILLAHTPDPLRPDEGESQTHTWWAAWQAVDHVHDRTGLPEGDYRLHIYGQTWTSGTTWPFETDHYELTSETFTVVPGALALEVSGSESGDLWVSIPGPDRGFRHLAAGGDCQGDNPVADHTVTVTWTDSEGETWTEEHTGVADGEWSLLEGIVPAEAVSAQVEDLFGNHATLDLE